jgi:hypothetical protein
MLCAMLSIKFFISLEFPGNMFHLPVYLLSLDLSFYSCYVLSSLFKI